MNWAYSFSTALSEFDEVVDANRLHVTASGDLNRGEGLRIDDAIHVGRV